MQQDVNCLLKAGETEGDLERRRLDVRGAGAGRVSNRRAICASPFGEPHQRPTKFPTALPWSCRSFVSAKLRCVGGGHRTSAGSAPR